ncbi:hypothetical protein AMATHDRAFT_66606 [Amanita thiersii Skay4041]|uniref:Uncharacterized protein n=1 Tax=Amanita thiersii Skay4041 TaxID=703135 RepID=A0A2A9NJM8_9AGAR|nr:hypothetical protein AMATHDRAFT_66606 [Amanita thiersii Skay4041]
MMLDYHWWIILTISTGCDGFGTNDIWSMDMSDDRIASPPARHAYLAGNASTRAA